MPGYGNVYKDVGVADSVAFAAELASSCAKARETLEVIKITNKRKER